MVGEGVAQEVDVLSCDLAGENVAIFHLTAAEELQGVGSKLQSTTQIGNEAILNCRLTRLPVCIDKKDIVENVEMQRIYCGSTFPYVGSAECGENEVAVGRKPGF